MPLLLSAGDVEAALPMAFAVDILEEGFRRFASGAFTMPQRLVMSHPDGILAAMPAADDQAMGIKVVTVHRSNPANNRPAVQGLVLLLDTATGEPLAIMDGTILTLIRTAAASAVATRHLANPGPAVLAVIGSGPLAVWHVRAMSAVRPLSEVRMYSPRLSSRWAEVTHALADLEVKMIRADSAEAAVRGSNLVVLSTSAAAPVINWRWISPGAHINGVGSHAPSQRELDSETVARSRVICDSVEACWAEAGDLIIPAQEKLITREATAALGDVVLGRVPGRRSPDEVTVFKSVGLAFEDHWSALHAWRRGRDQQLGLRWDVSAK
jgi:ornithine cyclodeaminase/alanine dehydrogenase-like protein (mu-crystallin family)